MLILLLAVLLHLRLVPQAPRAKPLLHQIVYEEPLQQQIMFYEDNVVVVNPIGQFIIPS